MKVDIRFRPLESQTLKLLSLVHYNEGDPVAAYGRHLSAFLMSAAMLGLSREQVMQQVETCFPQAEKSIEAHPEIFGQ